METYPDHYLEPEDRYLELDEKCSAGQVAKQVSTEEADFSNSWTETKQTAMNPGSAVAALWIRTSRDTHPPISVPRPIMPAQTCPRCQHSLSSPLKPSGLQSCPHCNWIG
jgi:hypothetical protein